jgi:hypothetical protein
MRTRSAAQIFPRDGFHSPWNSPILSSQPFYIFTRGHIDTIWHLLLRTPSGLTILQTWSSATVTDTRRGALLRMDITDLCATFISTLRVTIGGVTEGCEEDRSAGSRNVVDGTEEFGFRSPGCEMAGKRVLGAMAAGYFWDFPTTDGAT